MLSQNELLEIKQRVMVTSKMCKLLLIHDEETDDDEVRLTEDQYPIVVDAMEKNEEDISKLLAEVDVLRMSCGMFDLLTEGDSHGRDKVVSRTGEQEPEATVSREQHVEEPDADSVGRSGSDGEDTSRPKPRRNTKGTRKNSKRVVRNKKKQEVDSGTSD